MSGTTCGKCGQDLTKPYSVSRTYINKDDGDDAIGHGHYDLNGNYEPDTSTDLSNGRFDLVDNSDKCGNCDDLVG